MNEKMNDLLRQRTGRVVVEPEDNADGDNAPTINEQLRAEISARKAQSNARAMNRRTGEKANG